MEETQTPCAAIDMNSLVLRRAVRLDAQTLETRVPVA